MAPSDDDRIDAELERFSVSWRRALGSAKPENRLDIFAHAAAELAAFLSRGLERTVAADELNDMAYGAGLDDADAVQAAIAKAFEGKGDGRGNGHAEPHRLKLLKGKLALTPQPMGTVVRGICHAGSLTLIFGPPKSGKSFLATDLLLSIAAGDGQWMGHKIKRPGAVAYIACEGHAGFWKRLVAAQSHRGLLFPESFHLATGRPFLIALEDHGRTAVPHPEDVLVAINEMIAAGEPPVAICIDTMFRAIGTGNVNNSDHVNAFLAAIGIIMDRGIAVIVVHHETKAGGTPVGSVSLMGGADTIVQTTNLDDGKHSWEVLAAKDDATTEARKFKLEVIPVGTDPDGDEASSCVVVPIVGKVVKTKAKLTDAHAEFRDTLMDALAELGRDRYPKPGMPLVKAITRDELRSALIRGGWFHQPSLDGTIQLKTGDYRNLLNALRALKRRGIIGFDNDLVWLT